MFESRISAGAIEKLPGWEKSHANTIAWSYDMEGHPKKCVERHCELAKNTDEQQKKVSTPSLDDHQSKTEELGELSTFCSQIVLKCVYLARIGRLDTPWYVNNLSRKVMKWSRACDKRMARLTTYIHSTNVITDKNTAQHCRLALFQYWVCWEPWGLKIELGRNSVDLRKSNMRSHKLDVKETSFCLSQLHWIWGCWFAHGLYSRFRLGFGDWSIALSKKQPVQGDLLRDIDQRKHTNTNTKNTPTEMILDYSMWITLPQTQKTFEENERVIIVIITGWSPTMRHVSRTHRVALGCLTESTQTQKSKSITLIPKTNSQTCWRNATSLVMNGNHLLCLFNIMSFSIFVLWPFQSN